jgi:hypothetical protein
MLPDIMRPADNVFDLYRLGAALSSLSKAIAAKPHHEISFTDVYFEITPVQPLIESVCKDQFIPLDTCKANALKLRDLLAGITRTFLTEWRNADTPEKKTAMWDQTVGGARM